MNSPICEHRPLTRKPGPTFCWRRPRAFRSPKETLSGDRLSSGHLGPLSKLVSESSWIFTNDRGPAEPCPQRVFQMKLGGSAEAETQTTEKTLVLHKFRDFATGDDTDSEDAVGTKFKKIAVLRLHSIRVSKPPDLNVRVQQNHCKASQSSLATGPNGLRNSRTNLEGFRSRS